MPCAVDTAPVGFLLEVSGLTKRFGGLVAVDDFGVSVPQGKIYGLIGPNGAGKTTVFNLISGIYRPDSGHVRLASADIAGMPAHRIAAQGIGRTFQNIRLFKGMSVLENVVTALHRQAEYSLVDACLRTGGVKRAEAQARSTAMEILAAVGLAGMARVQGTSLPYGLQRKLEIARALALRPRLLLLDEPAAGLNPRETLDLTDLIQRITREYGLTVLLIEHHMDVVMDLCDRITVLNFGRVIAHGTPTEIQDNELVVEAYLGRRR
ncbi:MAG: ABC transporter ATP-binding protein [Firmicutes bacterium]|nr:ABC transporter ATP-binding protein [Bacillota bacterium]